MRYILEYEEKDIIDLMGDLEGVGLATKRNYVLWVTAPKALFKVGYYGRIEFRVALGTIHSKGSLELDKSAILNSLKEGKFLGLNQQDMERQKYDPAGVRILSHLYKQPLQEFFRSEGKDLDQAMKDLHTKLVEVGKEPGYHGGLYEYMVGLVYDDQDLTDGSGIKPSAPIEALNNTYLYKSGGVFFHDKTVQDDVITHPFD